MRASKSFHLRKYKSPAIIEEVRKMIANPKKLEEFEKKLSKKEKVDVMQNFRIVEALYRGAVTLRVIPMKDPLDGL